jgi:hypothetical protein
LQLITKTASQLTLLACTDPQITNQQTCVTVPAQRVAKVAQLQPVLVHLYDYYDRMESARLFYSAPSPSTCAICEKSDCGISCGLNTTESNEIVEQEQFMSGNSGATLDLMSKHLLLALLGMITVRFLY